MAQPFSAKLQLTLKVLSLSRGGLASELGVDKSVVSRWVTGAVRPSAQNLALVTALVAKRVPGFNSLDWDRDLDSLTERLGARPVGAPSPAAAPMGIPFDIMGSVLATTALRGAAYEGFYRGTRPLAVEPGLVVHDYAMIRLEPNGMLSLAMITGGVRTDGWLLPVQNQLFCVGVERANSSPVFGIFNGVGSIKVSVLDGLTLTSVLDAGRTPTSSAIVSERIGDLSGDRAADDATFASMISLQPTHTVDEIPSELRAHLLRDIGPQAAAQGGDLLLRMPVSRSFAK